MPATPPNPPAIGPDALGETPPRIAKYRILQEVGSGGFASVYFARAEGTDQPVALKVLRETVDSAVREQVRARFLAEKNIAAAIPHPAIVKILEASAPDAHLPYIAMEFIEGRTFGEYFRDVFARDVNPLSKQTDPGLQELARLGHQIATAMTIAHERGIVHRDLKPGNVLVTWDVGSQSRASVKILDFGIAKAPIKLFPVRHSASFTRYWTELGTVMGSPPYMAPEQDGAAHAVTGKADVYALGVMLLLALASIDERAVETGDFVVDLPRDREALLARRPGLPEPWIRLLRSMVELEPSARPDMAAAARTLQHLAQPNRDFADAVAAWLERGRVPTARRLVRFMAWAETASPLTDDEMLFLKRAPVVKLRSFRWAATLGLAAAGLACSSGLLAWFVGKQQESLQAYRARLTESEQLHARKVKALAAEREEELEKAQQAAEHSGTQTERAAQLATQLHDADVRLSGAAAELRAARAGMAQAESQRDEVLEREAQAIRERDAERRRLEAVNSELQNARRATLQSEERADSLAQQLETQKRNLTETTERLRLCTRNLRQETPALPTQDEPSPHARLAPP